jgi:hypothetical protein
LARRLAALTFGDALRSGEAQQERNNPLDRLANFMSAAEFLARETRSAD